MTWALLPGEELFAPAPADVVAALLGAAGGGGASSSSSSAAAGGGGGGAGGGGGRGGAASGGISAAAAEAEAEAAVGLDTTFHPVISQSRHIQLMPAPAWSQVTNLTHPGVSGNPTRRRRPSGGCKPRCRSSSAPPTRRRRRGGAVQGECS